MENKNKESQVEIKAYTKKEIADLYGISRHVLRVWLRSLPQVAKSKRQFFSAKEVKKIFEAFGVPSKLKCVK